MKSRKAQKKWEFSNDGTENNNSPFAGLGIYRLLWPLKLGQPHVGRKVISRLTAFCKFTAQKAPVLNIFMPRPWKSRSAAVLKISHFLPAIARSLGGCTNDCRIDCIWQGKQKTGKGLYWNGTEALTETSFLVRQFTAQVEQMGLL